MAVTGEQILQANRAGIVGPMAQAAQNQQALLT